MINTPATVLTATLTFSAMLTVAVVVASPFGASAQVTVQGDRAAERIGGAFETLVQAGIEAGQPARETYRMDCAGDVWPYIDASCVGSANDSSPSSVRIVY